MKNLSKICSICDEPIEMSELIQFPKRDRPSRKWHRQCRKNLKSLKSRAKLVSKIKQTKIDKQFKDAGSSLSPTYFV